MSDFQLPPKPRLIGRKNRIILVASRFNSAYTDALAENAVAEIARLSPETAIDLHHVPGAFEIGYAVEYLASHFNPDVIVALGVIIRGQTEHGDLIASSITESLQRTATEHLIPVVHEVLLVNDKEQAEQRTMGERLNRGREAARAAVSMLAVADRFRKTQPAKPAPTLYGKETRRP